MNLTAIDLVGIIVIGLFLVGTGLMLITTIALSSD